MSQQGIIRAAVLYNYTSQKYLLIDPQTAEGNLEKPIHGLKHTDVSKEDFESIAQFGRIVKNYQRMQRIENQN